MVISYDLWIVSSDYIIKTYDLVLETEESEKSSAAFGECDFVQGANVLEGGSAS